MTRTRALDRAARRHALPGSPRRHSMRGSGAALALCLCLVASPSVAAEGEAAAPAPAQDERVIALNEEGSALYAAGDYRRAVERFLEAYAVYQDPNLLFNIASCYEALGDVDAALEKYRAFLSAPSADPEGRPRAEQAIARLTAPVAPTAPEAAAAPTPVEPAPAAPVAADRGAGGLRWLPWAGLAGGVALGAVGATFYLMGASDHAEVTDSTGFDEPDAVANITRRRADDLVRSGDTKKAIGVASASVGAALVAGSIVWWLVDPAAPAADARAGLDVALDPRRPGIHYRGVF